MPHLAGSLSLNGDPAPIRALIVRSRDTSKMSLISGVVCGFVVDLFRQFTVEAGHVETLLGLGAQARCSSHVRLRTKHNLG